MTTTPTTSQDTISAVLAALDALDETHKAAERAWEDDTDPTTARTPPKPVTNLERARAVARELGAPAACKVPGSVADTYEVGTVVLDFEQVAWQKVDQRLWVATDGESARSLHWPGEDPQDQLVTVLYRPATKTGV